MRWIVLILLVSLTTSSYGQYKLVGVEGSLNLARVRPKGFSDGHKIGTAFGIDFQYLFKNPFSVGVGLNYEQKGFKSYTKISNGNTTRKLTHTTNINYLSIPLKGGLRFGNKLFGFTKVGVVPSLLINAKSISPNFDGNGKTSGSTTSDISNTVSKFDFSGLGEIGAGYMFNERYWLTASVLYQKSFTRVIRKDDYYQSLDIKHDVKTLTIGLKYLQKN